MQLARCEHVLKRGEHRRCRQQRYRKSPCGSGLRPGNCIPEPADHRLTVPRAPVTDMRVSALRVHLRTLCRGSFLVTPTCLVIPTCLVTPTWCPPACPSKSGQKSSDRNASSASGQVVPRHPFWNIRRKSAPRGTQLRGGAFKPHTTLLRSVSGISAPSVAICRDTK